MDVTPRELRDIEIREAFRGYNRDDVDELLERAAATIEALTERVRQLAERAQGAGAATGTPADDLIQRTLLLAQRTADEAVAEAEARAKALVDEAERRAAETTSEAETSARRRAEEEQGRITAELAELASRRDALAGDCDALERYAAGYRDRIREALERDLENLRGGGVVAAGPRPELSGVQVDVPAEEADAGPPTSPLAAVAPGGPGPGEAAPATSDAGRPAEGAAEPPAAGTGTGEPPPAEPPGREGDEPAPPPAGARAVTSTPRRERIAEPAGGELPPVDHLDDDAFFASLREAVSDDAPLGPREDADAPGDVFDQDADGGRGLFRRRG